MDNKQIKNNECEDIIRQAFPLGAVDRADFRIDNTHQIDNKMIILTVECQLPSLCSVTEHYLNEVTGRTYNVSNPEEATNKLAGCLFTILNERQIEEFNSTWEAMYTNWKRFGVKKI